MKFSLDVIQNVSDNLNCTVPHEITDLNEYLYCYSFFYQQSITESSLTLALIVGTVVFNAAVIYFIVKNCKKISIFDEILIGHAIVDGVTGAIDMPFYHIATCFGYWPLQPIIGQLWASYDNNINTVTNLHMLYLCWARLRSIQNPKSFDQELLLKNPIIVMVLIWLGSLLIWIPQV